MLADEFRLELVLHHPTCDPHEITEELSINPWFAVKHGIQIGNVVHTKTIWLSHFRAGSTAAEFTQALEETVSLFAEHRSFVGRFIEHGGTIEFLIDCATDSSFTSGDKLFELRLDPWFLSRLAENYIQLRLQVWIAESRQN